MKDFERKALWTVMVSVLFSNYTTYVFEEVYFGVLGAILLVTYLAKRLADLFWEDDKWRDMNGNVVFEE